MVCYVDDQIKENQLMGHTARIGKMKNAYKILVEKPDGKRPLGGLHIHLMTTLKYINKHNVRVWTDSTIPIQDQWLAHVNTVINFRFP
jgi:hypothetical protein